MFAQHPDDCALGRNFKGAKGVSRALCLSCVCVCVCGLHIAIFLWSIQAFTLDNIRNNFAFVGGKGACALYDTLYIGPR